MLNYGLGEFLVFRSLEFLIMILTKDRNQISDSYQWYIFFLCADVKRSIATIKSTQTQLERTERLI